MDDDHYSYTLNLDGVEATYQLDDAKALTVRADVRTRFEVAVRLDPPTVGAYAALFRGEEPLGAQVYDIETKTIRWEPAE